VSRKKKIRDAKRAKKDNPTPKSQPQEKKKVRAEDLIDKIGAEDVLAERA